MRLSDLRMCSFVLVFLLVPVLSGFTNIAHRGENHDNEIAEHSFAAYDRALADQADILELDVHQTSDHVLVVSHDRNMQRVFGVSLDITKTPYYILKQYRNSAGEHLLTVQEVFARYQSDPDIKIMMETKNEDYPTGMENLLISQIHQYGLSGRVSIESFSSESLELVKQLDANIPTVLLANGNQRVQQVENNNAYASSTYSSGTGKYLQQLGKHYYLWGTDDDSGMRHLISTNLVTGIFTNYPDRLSTILGTNTGRVRRIQGTIYIKYAPKYSVVVRQGYGPSGVLTNVFWQANSAHYATCVVRSDNHLWYGFGNNQWLDSKYISTDVPVENDQSTKKGMPGIVRIKFKVGGHGYSVLLWHNPDGTQSTGRMVVSVE